MSFILCLLIADQGLYKAKVDYVDKFYELADVSTYTAINAQNKRDALRDYALHFNPPPSAFFEQKYLSTYQDTQILQVEHLVNYIKWLNGAHHFDTACAYALWNDKEAIRKRLPNGLTENFIRLIPGIIKADHHTWMRYNHPYFDEQVLRDRVETIYLLELQIRRQWIFYIKFKDTNYIKMQHYNLKM